ncbi:hypothetical protein Pmani_034261 [Petrolisthes manimaculis]|uniref:Myotubularin-related protein 14 n=1 Tax=Petrolisthes manimaculis TaxID=1843537 RepID=A0AAE1NQ96_9EUCA|nr:hypothetical protein Pmani_034261 [Petrolisthes manimaculis]
MSEAEKPHTGIGSKDVEELLIFFSKNTYRAKDTCPTYDVILDKCLELFELDYKCIVVPNPNGELCNSYPTRLIIPETEVVPEGMEESVLPCPLTLASPSVQPQTAAPSFSTVAPSFSAVVSGVPQSTSVAVNGSQTDAAAAMHRKCSLPGEVGRNSSNSSLAGQAETQSDGSRLRELILKAKFARCRARFPVPVILYKGNYLCRSATLSGGPEMYGRSGIEYLFAAATSRQDDDDDDDEVVVTSSDWQLFDRVRSMDIRLLKACSVGVIIDLMVEKKKVKFGMYVTSSEKVDKENRYCDFNIVSLPYPGCEFFKEFRDLGYTADSLYFNWSQAFVDAHLVVPDRSLSARVTHDWSSYRRWDLVRLTQNYLRLLLTYAHEGAQGILLHCISGWDRTPLFLSLLRLSLWADGLIHSSLDHIQILYLTIAYDWLAFGHDLQDRLAKGEEIFFFCFYFLKFMTSEDYTISRRRHASSDSTSLERLDCVLLEAGDGGLSSAGSSNSLNSSCSSSRSSHPPSLFRTGKTGTGGEGDSYGAHLTWPYGSYTGELDFDDLSPNLSRASSTSSSSATAATSSRGAFGRSSFREGDSSSGSGDGKLTVRSSGAVGYSVNRTKTNPDTHHGKPHRPMRSRNGHSESSGESGGTGPEHPDTRQVSTSPVAVPVPRRIPAPRQRQESTGSIGSWQIVDEMGSLQDTPGAAAAAASGQLGSAGSRISRVSGVSDLVDSATTIKEEVSLESEESIIVFNRAERLAKVRALFYNLYVSTIGLNAPNGRTDTGLGTLVSNFAQKVGIRQSSSRNT